MITVAAHRYLSTLLLSICSLACSVKAAANEAPPPIRDEIPHAVLQGTGTYRWFGLAIYDAALWMSTGSPSDMRQRFALDLTYARNLYGSKIAEASIDEIGKLKLGTTEKRQQWLLQMKGIFPDVKEGSRITGIHIPNEAARFYLNGKLLGEIRDPEFAHSFFAIWLDKKTSAPDLRNKLLGNSEKTYQ
ncbi:chalcone isomerase family protein [Undibacterium aquatile]|uniref:Chalcone isomerase family protein n=1 Tax=Undibacterium aquatile TaxID=1537398 RepID=A0ABR6XIB0_9BURK|nr:chalcone isomerase family protein [Undibacterium aquatile]MBC3812591.1 chalcone isomerase family protein [Undibacterium aquatile]